MNTAPQHNTTLLEVHHLRTEFTHRDHTVAPVQDISLTLQRGQIMGLVGESGSGKSMTAYSLMGLLDPPGQVVGGTAWFSEADGTRVDLLKLPAPALRQLRGNRIAMIFQDPMLTLNPVLRIDTQMIETLQAHQAISKTDARNKARAALVKVGIAAPDERLNAYPHELSGGMRQRIAIAIALLNEPNLIIADEPTTALDVSIAAQILFEIQTLCQQLGTALLWITHDLSVVAQLADTVAVMYAGKIVESGTTAQVLHHPQHPYTAGLLQSIPFIHQRAHLQSIPGQPPKLDDLPPGCAFAPRCSYAQADCATPPALQSDVHGQAVRCLHPLIGAQP
ncbi:ABC transporter ATP-binding protein [Ampullimonas aquatilis]|uniref:ABC transporter ATP-binding protein n=1 Tax=Ampullimonas aquatilis TaxID=1341549 RepID=UPI003C741510